MHTGPRKVKGMAVRWRIGLWMGVSLAFVMAFPRFEQRFNLDPCRKMGGKRSPVALFKRRRGNPVEDEDWYGDSDSKTRSPGSGSSSLPPQGGGDFEALLDDQRVKGLDFPDEYHIERKLERDFKNAMVEVDDEVWFGDRVTPMSSQILTVEETIERRIGGRTSQRKKDTPTYGYVPRSWDELEDKSVDDRDADDVGEDRERQRLETDLDDDEAGFHDEGDDEEEYDDDDDDDYYDEEDDEDYDVETESITEFRTQHMRDPFDSFGGKAFAQPSAWREGKRTSDVRMGDPHLYEKHPGPTRSLEVGDLRSPFDRQFMPAKSSASDFLLEIPESDEELDEWLESLRVDLEERSDVTSPSLDFFLSSSASEKSPTEWNVPEPFERLMAAAVDPDVLPMVKGVFENFGVYLPVNFDDFRVSRTPPLSIEEVAFLKAKRVYESTGLSTIAGATSFEVAPSRQRSRERYSPINAYFRLTTVGPSVERLIEMLRPVSEPDRATSFRTVLCFYDGERALLEFGECDVDLEAVEASMSAISASGAVTDLASVMAAELGLRFEPVCYRGKFDFLLEGETEYVGSSLLKERLLRDGRVYRNGIIDVSPFMDTNVDIALMRECAAELSARFTHLRPTKIVTVATTGLIIALPMAEILQIPLVYARKDVNVANKDSIGVRYSSRTQGTNRELHLRKNLLSEDDQVLIVDDFLSGGSVQDALLRLVKDTGATSIGIAVLIEKAYKAGRQYLSGWDLPIESLACVASVDGESITLCS